MCQVEMGAGVKGVPASEGEGEGGAATTTTTSCSLG